MKNQKLPGEFRFVIAIGCILVCLVLNMSRVEAASLKKITKACENSMLSQAVMLYISLGTLTDMVRSKRYKRDKAAGVLRLLSTQIEAQNLMMKSLKVRGSVRARKFFHSCTTVFLLMQRVSKALQGWLQKKRAADLKDYFTYRNAVVRDVSRLLRSRSRRYWRRYRGGRKTVMRCMSDQLKREMIVSYSTLGILSDAYFSRLLNPQRTQQFLLTLHGMLKTNLSVNKQFVAGTQRAMLAKLQTIRSLILKQAGALLKFMRTRKRSFLNPYRDSRQRAWNLINTLEQTKP